MSKNKRWVLASIFAGLATFTRLNGLALFFFVLFEYLVDQKYIGEFSYHISLHYLQKPRLFFRGLVVFLSNAVQNKLYALLVVPAVFISYLYYLNQKFGDWHVLFQSMEKWGQSSITFPPQVFYRYFKIVFVSPTFLFNYWVAALELLFATLFVVLIIYTYKRISFSYWILLMLSFLIPAMTGTFQGMPRYGLHVYPLFLALYLWLKDQSVTIKISYFIFCSLLLIFYTAYYSRGFFVA